MSAEAAFYSRSWQVGERTVTMTLQRPRPGSVLHAAMEWHPSPPKSLSAAEWAQYRSGRDGALAELSHELGINAAVLEI